MQQRGLGSRSYNNCLIRRPIKFEISFISVPLKAPFGCANGYQLQNLPCNKLGSTFSSPVNLICKLVTLAFSSLVLRLLLTASIGNWSEVLSILQPTPTNSFRATSNNALSLCCCSRIRDKANDSLSWRSETRSKTSMFGPKNLSSCSQRSARSPTASETFPVLHLRIQTSYWKFNGNTGSKWKT